MRLLRFTAFCLAALALPVAASAQPDTAARLETQRQAMARLSFMDGVWRGPAWAQLPGGRRELTQTERVGPFLGGSVRVVEGRGYEADGRIGFNALGVISFDPATAAFSIRTFAQGQAGVYALTLIDGGVVWEIPAGPGMVIRHTAMIGNGRWHEISELIAEGRPPLRVAELDLRRVGDTGWPAGGAVPMR
jgi:hypothetical protein